MKTCPRCGEKSGGFFKLCGLCDQTNTLMITGKKTPKTPHIEPEDEE